MVRKAVCPIVLESVGCSFQEQAANRSREAKAIKEKEGPDLADLWLGG